MPRREEDLPDCGDNDAGAPGPLRFPVLIEGKEDEFDPEPPLDWYVVFALPTAPEPDDVGVWIALLDLLQERQKWINANYPNQRNLPIYAITRWVKKDHRCIVVDKVAVEEVADLLEDLNSRYHGCSGQCIYQERQRDWTKVMLRREWKRLPINERMQRILHLREVTECDDLVDLNAMLDDAPDFEDLDTKELWFLLNEDT